MSDVQACVAHRTDRLDGLAVHRRLHQLGNVLVVKGDKRLAEGGAGSAGDER